MSKIFGIIAAVILAFAAFVAMKNQQAYKAEIERLHVEQAEEKSTIKELAEQQKRLKDAEEARDGYIANNEEVRKKLEVAIKDFNDSKKLVEELKQEHKRKEAKIAEANDALKDLPNPDDLIPKVKRMRAGLAEAENGIATEETNLANLARQEEDGKARIAALKQIVSDYTNGNSLASMKTSIQSIYRSWGFVILSGGNREGVVPSSKLDVMRGDEVVAKLRVTAVEAGRSAADIIPDSLAEGGFLMVGDVVIPEQEVNEQDAAGAQAEALAQ